MSKLLWILLVGCLLVLRVPQAWANDGVGSVALGEVTLGKTDNIAMQREVLEIGWKEIRVDYDFVNESDQDVTETIVFPLPDYGAEGRVTAAFVGQPYGFKLEVDGKSVPFRTHVEAVSREVRTGKTRVVTGQLRSLGLSDRQIALYHWMPEYLLPNLKPLPQGKVPGLTSRQVTLLKQHGLFDDPIPDVMDGGPNWVVKVTYTWRQTFPARRKVHVHHRYTPFITSGIWDTYREEQDMVSRYCADEAFLKVWRREMKPGKRATYPELPGTSVSYILKTANTWKDGIRDFTLRIRKSRPQEIVSLCFPGTPRRVNATTLEFRHTNFRPRRDLEVYFGNLPSVPGQAYETPGEAPLVP